HLNGEWSTCSFIFAPVQEKDAVQYYENHLADIKKWCDCNSVVTEKLRTKWFKRAAQNFGIIEAVQETHIGEEDQRALRLELEGRTGDTDSEDEGDAEAT
ncbi:hypothetical protein C8F04DRAFT_967727, partial [Mycena alexandri]